METKFLSSLITEHLVDNRYIKLYLPFNYYSKSLKQEIRIPANFICDFESVPLLKGSSKRGGVIHDYFCRKDSIPLVTKQEAANLYFEAQECKDKKRKLKYGFVSRFRLFCTRYLKVIVVRVAWGYFHKHNVLSTLEEVSGEK